jgi:hypothetical protein
MTNSGSSHTNPSAKRVAADTSDKSATGAVRTPYRDVSDSSATNAILGVTMVALGGSPRLALRAAYVLLKDSHDSRSARHGARTRRWVRRP